MTAKRAVDLVGGLTLLLLLAPLAAAVALSLALGSPPPGGAPGPSGVSGTPGASGASGAPGPSGGRAALGGAVLRRRTVAGLHGRPFTLLTFRTRSPLAALPLLLHVVRGEMSLVGPCPLAPTHRECTGEGRRRLSVRPGLTGPWQISGRSDLPWEERQLLDLHYVDHHWLGMDLAVLARTLPAVRRRRRGTRTPARTARVA